MSQDALSSDSGLLENARRLASVPLGRALQFAVYVAIALVVAFMLVTGRSYGWRDRIFPFIVGTPTIALCLSQLVFIVRPKWRERFTSESETSGLQEKLSQSIEGTGDGGREPTERRRVELQLLAVIAVLPVAVYYLGMVLVLPVWVFGFAWHFYGSPKAAAVTTTIFAGLSYVIFVVFLGLQPWAGALFV